MLQRQNEKRQQWPGVPQEETAAKTWQSNISKGETEEWDSRELQDATKEAATLSDEI